MTCCLPARAGAALLNHTFGYGCREVTDLAGKSIPRVRSKAVHHKLAGERLRRSRYSLPGTESFAGQRRSHASARLRDVGSTESAVRSARGDVPSRNYERLGFDIAETCHKLN